AKDDTDSGAIAFVKHYVAVLNYAAVTGDTAELKRLSSPKCEGCQEYIDLYEETYDNGGYFKGGEWRLSDVEVSADDASTFVFGRMSAEPSTYKKTATDRPSTGIIEDVDLVFGLARNSDSW